MTGVSTPASRTDRGAPAADTIGAMSTPLDSPDQGGLATLDRELEELIREENIEPGDHERFSHYVKKDKILESALTGKPVRALCGKKWTPGRDPEKFPVCPTCKEIYESMTG